MMLINYSQIYLVIFDKHKILSISRAARHPESIKNGNQ